MAKQAKLAATALLLPMNNQNIIRLRNGPINMGRRWKQRHPQGF